MAHFKSPEWDEILTCVMENWWPEAVDLARSPTVSDRRRLSSGFGNWTNKIVRWCDQEKTNIDPAPFWRLSQALRRFYEPRIDDAARRPNAKDLELLLDEAQIAVERLKFQGTVDNQQDPASTAAAANGSQQACAAPPRTPTLVIHNGPQPKAVVDGEPYVLKGNMPEYLQALIAADGLPVSANAYGVKSRNLDGLPRAIKDFITRSQAGCFIPRGKLYPQSSG